MLLLKSLKVAALLVFLTGTVVSAQSESKPIEMKFANDIAMGIPAQDVYIDARLVTRVQGKPTDAMLAQPVYASTDEVPGSFSEPFKLGPFPKGEPLGFTLGQWLAAEGSGVYTVNGNRGTLDLQFKRLVPKGVYTLWCVDITLVPEMTMAENPCGAADGSENTLQVDAAGNAAIKITGAAFPPASEQKFIEVGLAYHSDGTTYGAKPGLHGKNLHGQLFFDFTTKFNGMKTVKMDSFATDLQMGVPVQEVYIDAGLVVRPKGEITSKMLTEPLYRAKNRVEPDFLEEPFEVGPFEKGEPHGFTLGDWLAATGTGTYTAHGTRATLDVQFAKLVPNGLYTLWCTEISLPPHPQMAEKPCGAADGSENAFRADKDGKAAMKLEIDAFPPSTKEVIHEVAIAYHSDGKTYGKQAGDFGRNVHVQLAYDFLAPEK